MREDAQDAMLRRHEAEVNEVRARPQDVVSYDCLDQFVLHTCTRVSPKTCFDECIPGSDATWACKSRCVTCIRSHQHV